MRPSFEPRKRPALKLTLVAVHPVSIRGITKKFGGLRAVNDLTLDVNEGEIIGFLGLNGAGKTTTIRILLDLLRPTSGTASIFGHDCQRDGIRARASLGFLPGEIGIFADMTGRAVLDLLAGMQRQHVDLKRRRELQDRLELPDHDLVRKLREYSTGMKRKLGIIQAFQSDPQLLILDEPTEGLDPLMQQSFYELLADMKRQGRTVFMSSHVLSEVDRVCDRIALLRKGELVLLTKVGEIRNLAPRRVHIALSEESAVPTALFPGIEIVSAGPRRWMAKVQGPLGPLLKAINCFPVSDIEIAEPQLEDVVLHYYRGDQQ
jgi:ABC-2 type transport system ATP-binding protein